MFAAQRGNRNSRISLRKRLHVNTLITEPGTVEIDWSSLYSLSSTNFTMPAGVRYTPEGPNIAWGRTEYLAAIDSLTSPAGLTLAATSVLYDGPKLDVAFAPQATIFLKNESGTRLGAFTIVRYDFGRNSIGATASWSAATHSSPSNPGGTWDAGFGFGHQLSGTCWLEKLTAHVNAEWERSTGQPPAALGSEGIEYQVTDRLALDLSAQHFAGAGNPPDHQIAFGLTLSLGKTQ